MERLDSKRSLKIAPAILLIHAALSACSGSAVPTLLPPPEMDPSGMATAVVLTPAPETQVGYPLAAKPLAELAALDLAAREAVPVDEVQLVDLQPVEWPDASLGCPTPGTDYAQVLTPGYEITLVADGVSYTYHTDQGDFVVLCLEGEPDELLVIPILPGEKIMDGVPWMPVDAIPTGEGEIVDPAPIK